MRRTDWIMLWTLSLLWGGSFLFVELALAGLPPLSVVWGRVALASVILWVVLLVSRTAAGHIPRGGAAVPDPSNTPHRMTDASATRPQTTLMGGSPASASSTKRNDPPHKRDKVQSMIQSVRRIPVSFPP